MKNCRDLIRESVIEDPKIGAFLEAGVFGRELHTYLRDKVIPYSGLNEKNFSRYLCGMIPCVDVGYMFENIGGRYRGLIRGLGNGPPMRIKTYYPGKFLYYQGNLQGYPRLIHEISESAYFSEKEMSFVGILMRIKKEGFAEESEFTKNQKNIKTLLGTPSLGIPQFVRETGRLYVLSDFSKEIFSPEIQQILSALVEWEYRIDVIP